MSETPAAAAGRRRVVLASGNAGKLRELGALLAPLGLELVAQDALGIQAPAEPHPTFVENALAKARHAAAASGLPAVADDSGLVVDALAGAPGVASARYAGPGASDEDNVRRLLDELAGEQRRSARFHCVLVYLRRADDPMPVIAEASWEGTIARAPRGVHGFGYDPVFEVPGRGCTSAELDPAEKDRLSHRGQAARMLLARLRAGGGGIG